MILSAASFAFCIICWYFVLLSVIPQHCEQTGIVIILIADSAGIRPFYFHLVLHSFIQQRIDLHHHLIKHIRIRKLNIGSFSTFIHISFVNCMIVNSTLLPHNR